MPKLVERSRSESTMMRSRMRAVHHGHLIGPTSIVLTLFMVYGPMVQTASTAEPEDLFDVLIRRGRIIDGTGAAERSADVAIRNGRIVAIGDLSAARARDEVDARNDLVCPGFVDLHTHVDRGILT